MNLVYEIAMDLRMICNGTLHDLGLILNIGARNVYVKSALMNINPRLKYIDLKPSNY